MSRLALRYYLPIVQVVLLLGLVVSAQVERYEAAHRPPEEVTWDPRTGRPDIFVEAFSGLNLPVFLAVLPLGHILPSESEWLFALATLLAILVFWYGIGRIVDRFRGLLPSKPLIERGAVWRRFGWTALGVSAFAFAAGVLLLFRSDEVASLYAYPCVVWAGLVGLWLISEMRRPSESLALNLKS